MDSATHTGFLGELVSGKYRVDGIIGQGGMGLVLSARHEQLEQRVALKFLLPAVAEHEDLVERFLREARAAVKIHSEHVARVHDVGTHAGLPFMVMEFLEGSDLGELVTTRGALPPRDAVGYVLEACDAIAEAHALGIVHRDLKPANLFLARTPSGRPIVKVLDFGISKVPLSEAERAVTHATAIMGSPSYMSPEQLVAAASVDARSDLWSLGVVLYELLTGELPFSGATMPELVAVILQKPPVPLRELRPDIPIELAHVVDRCLQRERELRFQSVAELARALAPFAAPRQAQIVERIEGVLGVAPTSVRPEPLSLQRTMSPAENRTLVPQQVPRPAEPKRASWLLLAPFAVLLAIVGFVGFHAFGRRPPPVQPATGVVEPTTLATAPVTPVDPHPTALIVPDPVTPTATAQASRTPVHTHASAAPPVGIASASASAVAPTAPQGSACHTVSYFDQNGDKHFKLECH